MRLGPFLLLALLLAPLAPAGADHVYSHRFVIEGRLVGSDGTPIPNRTVEFFATGDSFTDPCAEASRPVTDENGDFWFCFHKHGLRVETRVGVRAGNATAVRPMDTAFRRTVVTLEEPNETGLAPQGWERSFLVAGRAWRAGERQMEGVRVYGETLGDQPVNVTLRAPGDAGSAFQVRTDAFGDFRVPLRLEEGVDPANVTVVLEMWGREFPARLDLGSHRSTVALRFPAPEQDAVETRFVPPSPLVAPPGSETPRLGFGLVVAVGLGLAGALALARAQRR